LRHLAERGDGGRKEKLGETKQGETWKKEDGGHMKYRRTIIITENYKLVAASCCVAIVAGLR